MKVTFLTNVPSYYQIQLANSLIRILGNKNFRIIFYRALDQARLEMGWKDDYFESSIIRFWESNSQKLSAQNWITNSDVVIHGRFPIELVRKRIIKGKLTFAYQERLWKKSFYRLDTLWRLFSLYKNYWSVNLPNYHFLAAGAYASADIAKLGCFKNRRWKFGYFIDPYPTKRKINSTEKINLLWCGRLIDWKNPITAIKIANELRQRKIDFSLKVIGDGPDKSKIERLIESQKLGSIVELLGWQSHEDIKKNMKTADVFLMTSNRKEGWGVVVNEAMSQGCCIIANKQAGASNWLIEEGETGFLYDESNLTKVTEIIIKLQSELTLCHSVGMAGNKIHNDLWSTEIAAQRVIELSEGLLNEKDMRYHFRDGPCSTD